MPILLILLILFVIVRQDLFEDFNREINPRFTAQTYDLLKHNCNNYTDESAKFLLGKGIPSCELLPTLASQSKHSSCCC